MKNSVSALRLLAMDEINAANSGHPGVVLGFAPVAYTLWHDHLKITPKAPLWFDRDRFVLSSGHASSMLYALLHLTGYNVTLDDLVNAFEKFLERVDFEKPVHTKITKKELSVEDRIVNIKSRFKKEKRIDFFDLFEVKTKEYVVVTFLAILEMAKNKELIIYQDSNFDSIICEAI